MTVVRDAIGSGRALVGKRVAVHALDAGAFALGNAFGVSDLL